ncbi:hypothetical protein JTB14_009375 [Gonioctena quinquepunctata]|nr:hypothetical protein JTB14_009375 [Gonioctena quinquepunctata]
MTIFKNKFLGNRRCPILNPHREVTRRIELSGSRLCDSIVALNGLTTLVAVENSDRNQTNATRRSGYAVLFSWRCTADSLESVGPLDFEILRIIQVLGEHV